MGLVLAGVLVADPTSQGAGDLVPGPIQAQVVEVIDGDTIAVRATIWLGQNVETRVRVAGVDAPELRGACSRERTLAVAARELVMVALGDGIVTLTDIRFDKFGGRVVAHVASATGQNLSALLVDSGLGHVYDGRQRGSWCDAGD